MANTLVTPTWVTNSTALRFMNSVKGVAQFRVYSDEFRGEGAKVGNTVQVRLPQRYTIRRGQAWSPQALYDRTVPVTLTYQSGVDFEWSSAQKTTEIDKVKERYINPAADVIASDADAMGMADVYKSIYNCIGTPGTTPSTTLQYLQAGVKIGDLAGSDERRIAVLDLMAAATIANTVSTLFNPKDNISEAYRRGRIDSATLGIHEWFQDQNVPRHTTGTFTACSPTVNGASQTGSTLVTQAWASGATTLKAGDKFTIANVYSVNPISRVSTGRLQDFVVTADASDTTGAITLNISPSIITSGALQTVDSSPANGAAITVWSANPSSGTLSTTVSPQSLIFHPDFAAFAMADLNEPEAGAGAKATVQRSKDWGISIRFLQFYMGETDQNGNRLDIIHGAWPVRPELACRMVG
jgi:coat protein Gp5